MTDHTIDLEAGLRGMYARIDATDDEVFDDLFAADGKLAFNGSVVAETPRAILGFVRDRESQFSRIVHHIGKVTADQRRNTVVAEIRVDFTDHDGVTVPVDACGIVEYRGDQIAEWRLYVDTGQAG